MICANLPCLKEFEPTHGRQRYCCKKCCNAAVQRQPLQQARKKREQMVAHARNYRNGKLPPWMYS